MRVDGGSNITIGSDEEAHGNLISTRSVEIGVSFVGGGSGNAVQHNFVGTDRTGTVALPNDIGVVISSTSGAYENFAVLDNLISGNGTLGIAIGEIDGLEMKRNLIGTDIAGTGALGNQWQGVGVGFVNTVTGQTIGGTDPGDGNTIAFNGRDGVTVDNNSRVALLGNSIFSNTQLGIDLGGGGNNNDAGDPDTGNNQLQNFPVLSAAPTIDGGTLEISYSVDSTSANAAYPLRVEFFMADADGQEGMTYLGFDEYTASDYSGCVVAPCTKMASVALVGDVADGDTVLATATDAEGNTSEFGDTVTAAVGCLTVTTTADAGTGSLREAIGCANAQAGLDTITFAIGGDGPHVITLVSDLPEIDDPVVIDGSSQAGNSAVCSEAIADRPDYGIVIDGNGVATQIVELGSGSDGSTIQGLNLRGGTTYGILASGGGDGGHAIRCNFIGTDETGLAADANGVGIAIIGVEDVTVGGTDPSDGNLISGNSSHGIWFLGSGATGELVQGNYIGTDKTGIGDLGNGGAGVHLQIATGTVVVGGTDDGEGNVIAFNSAGVADSTDTTGHTVRGNNLFSNTGLGIDLGDDGATANDPDDGDTGANELQNSPHLLDATSVDGMLSIGYQVDSANTNSAYPLTVDFYLADGDGEEGSVYLGSNTYEAADAQGAVRVSFANPGSVGSGDLLVATATDASGNTSEFSAATEVNAFLVSTMADSDVGSLRQAITNANNNSGDNWITFAITGDGPHVISPLSDLPAFTEPVILAGTTQAGNALLCTDGIAERATYQIVLHGDADGSAVLGDGLVLATGAAGSTIQGLNIRNFSGSGILVDNSSDNAILCNFLGTDQEGATAVGNGVGVFVNDSDNTQIGGGEEGDGNLISGHTAGVSPGSGNSYAGSGVLIAEGDADGTVIQGNVFGTDKAGSEGQSAVDLGNAVGVLTDATGGSVTNTTIGGGEEGEGNVFAFNGDGVVIATGVSGVSVQGNSFYANDTLGIDLQVGGVAGRTANDAGDPDDDANRGQNFPVLTTDASTGDLLVTFSVDTETANATYPLTVELFLADSTGAQGEMPLDTVEYTASDYSGCGVAPCTETINLGPAAYLGLSAGAQVLGTATDADGNSSEFSDPAAVAGLVDLAVTIAESVDPVIAGSGIGNLVYTVTVSNDALVDATGVVLSNTLTLPTGVTAVSQVPSAGSFSGTTWTLGPLAAGGSETLIVTLTAESSAATGIDVITDAVAVTAVNETDTDSSNDTASESTSIARQVDLAVSVLESVDPAVAGSGAGNLVYTVMVSNGGPSNATGVVLANTLTLPAGVNVVSQVPSVGSFSDTAWTLGTLAAGANATLTVTLTVDASASAGTDVVGNAAAVTAVNETDTNTTNDGASASTSITRQVDLAVSVGESVDPAVAGTGPGNLVYTVTVSNSGLVDATGVVLSNVLTLPAGVTVVSQVPSVGTFSGTAWTLGNLAAGNSATLTVTLTVEASAAAGTDVITDTATITAVNETDTNALNDSASESTSIIRSVDLAVSVTESADPAVAGSGAGNLIYTVEVSNNGLIDATGVSLSNALTLPTGVTVDSQVPSAGSFSGTAWTLGTVAAGVSETLTVTLTVGSSAAVGTDVITDTATVTAVNEIDADSSNDTASESTSISRGIDLSVTVSESVDPVVAGSGVGNLVYTVEVSNSGRSDATGVILENTLTLPSDVTVDSQVPSLGSFSGTTWDLGTLAAGSSETLTVTLTAAASAAVGTDVITNTAAITAVNEPDSNSANDTASESTSIGRELDLAVSVAESTGLASVLAGGSLSYELTAANVGASDATGVVLTETVPEHTTFDAAASSDGWQCLPDNAAGSICTLAVGDLASGDQSSVLFVVDVDAVLSREVEEIVNTTTVGTAGLEVDVNPADNSDELSTPVDLPPIVSLVDTVASTTDSELLDGEHVRVPVTQILIEFSEPVIGGDLPLSFRLVEAGADGVISTTTCPGIQGDDRLITIEATVYDEPVTRLELGSGLALQRDRYRLIACGSEIEDAAGQLLDGNFDDVAGGDFSLGFAVSDSNLLENPNFDQGLAAWTSLDFDWDGEEDADQHSSSGAAAAMPVEEGVLAHPCVQLDPSENGIYSSMSAVIQDLAGVTPSVQLELLFFAEGDCQGELLRTAEMSRIAGDTAGQWVESGVWTPVPEGAVSAQPIIRYRTTDAASSAALIDRLTLIPMIYGNGFETGGTDDWPLVVP